MKRPESVPQARSAFNLRSTTLIAVVAAVAVLYVAREFLIPFALALLISFLLTPLAVRLRRWGFGRIPSVLAVVTVAIVTVGTIGTLVAFQFGDMARQLPQYQANIHRKVQSVRASSSGIANRVSRAIHDLSDSLSPASQTPNAPGEEKPVPVEIRHNPFSPFEIVRQILGSVINVMLAMIIIIVFVIFMLLQREDLRDRFIRLIGSGQMNTTTQALDEAADRVSRYLLAQLCINTAFGVMAGVGLHFLKVPNPVLWGVLGAILRYVPYLGIWIAAIMPAAVALAVNPGWWAPVGIFGLFAGVDLVLWNFAEPLVYGSSTGISPMGILVAAVFWTWLWGPVGLLLATPLTVCVVVIGRYVPSLGFLSVLLGDEPVLSPDKRFYQRLLAMDVDEATRVAREFVKGRSLEELYDTVIVPALSLAEEDRHRGRLDETRQRYVFHNTRDVITEIAESADAATGEAIESGQSGASPRPGNGGRAPDFAVLCMPARDEADEICSMMLSQLLQRRGLDARSVSTSALASERIEEAARGNIRAVCVSAVPPFGFMHARYLCKRLRSHFSELKIIAAILNRGDPQDIRRREPGISANEVATTLRQAVDDILALVGTAPAQSSPSPTNP